jgi:hypothetical protein
MEKARQAVVLFTAVNRLEAVLTVDDTTVVVAAEEVVVPVEEEELDAVEPDAVDAPVDDEPLEVELDVLAADEDVVVVDAVVEVLVEDVLDVLSIVPLVVPALELVADAPVSEPLAPHAVKTTQQATREAPRPKEKDIRRPTGKHWPGLHFARDQRRPQCLESATTCL